MVMSINYTSLTLGRLEENKQVVELQVRVFRVFTVHFISVLSVCLCLPVDIHTLLMWFPLIWAIRSKQTHDGLFLFLTLFLHSRTFSCFNHFLANLIFPFITSLDCSLIFLVNLINSSSDFMNKELSLKVSLWKNEKFYF